jgi:hypothetical protein
MSIPIFAAMTEDDEKAQDAREDNIREWQRKLRLHLVPNHPAHLPALIQTLTGQDITDSMHEGACQIRRAVFAWVDDGRAEWIDGSLDYFRYIPPFAGRLTARKVSEPTAAELRLGPRSCDCGARWQGESIAHCATCHLTFTAVGNFDYHRYRGQCRTAVELRAKGYEPNEEEHWRKPMPEGRKPWDKS